MIDWLNKWYEEQCNGEWEHSYGIKIETIDNPGWHLTIDLSDTPYQLLSCPLIKIENNFNDWLHFKIDNNTFIGFSSINNLNELVASFHKIISTQINPEN